ncbi:MAG: MFS transporter [bacterium]|nr:MFS transporter [bacterium]MDE0288537.1 MFS transporter [bacterium]MDE0438798.1 MFS transporter [bacterium]
MERESGILVGLTTLMLLAMGVSTMASHALGILAGFLIEEFSITRAELGAVIAVSSALAAVVAIPAGRAVDLVGAKRSLLAVFAVSALSFFLYALARNMVVMYAASAIAAVPLSAANSATNKTIALYLPPRRRGIVTGVKQSGVSLALFLSGVALPPVALLLGWRAALGIVGALTVVALVSTGVAVPREPERQQGEASEEAVLQLDPGLVALTVFAFLLGFANSAVAFIPLYAQEVLLLSPVLAGAAAGLAGFAAVVGRVIWARIADQSGEFERALQWQAAAGAVAFGLILTAPYGVGMWQLAAGALMMGFTTSSWNSVGMLAVISRTGSSRAGSQSGVVMFGFMAGLGIGPPIQGWSVDLAGNYLVLWTMSLVLASIASVIMTARVRRR